MRAPNAPRSSFTMWAPAAPIRRARPAAATSATSTMTPAAMPRRLRRASQAAEVEQRSEQQPVMQPAAVVARPAAVTSAMPRIWPQRQRRLLLIDCQRTKQTAGHRWRRLRRRRRRRPLYWRTATASMRVSQRDIARTAQARDFEQCAYTRGELEREFAERMLLSNGTDNYWVSHSRVLWSYEWNVLYVIYILYGHTCSNVVSICISFSEEKT